MAVLLIALIATGCHGGFSGSKTKTSIVKKALGYATMGGAIAGGEMVVNKGFGNDNGNNVGHPQNTPMQVPYLPSHFGSNPHPYPPPSNQGDGNITVYAVGGFSVFLVLVIVGVLFFCFKLSKNDNN